MADLENPVIHAAIAEVVETKTREIRAKARADHADELAEAGHEEAAAYLRAVLGD